MNEEFAYRRATMSDASALSLVGAATFLDTYAHRINGSDIVAHVAGKHSLAYYEKALDDSETHIWVAQTATDAIVGYLLMGPPTLPDDAPHPEDLEIIRIYVLSRFQKAGLGYHLMQRAVTAATERRARQIVLGVYHGNEKALAFYARQGFVQIGTRSFQVGSAVFHDFVLGKIIGP